MNIEKVIEYMKSDVDYAIKNNYKKSTILFKVELINSIIDFYNDSENEINNLENKIIEQSHIEKKLKLMLVITGIDLKEINRNLNKPILFLLSLFKSANKNENGVLANKKLMDFFIKYDIKNNDFQMNQLINKVNGKNNIN